MTDGHTELFCLLGNPVGHSLSPKMHNMAFDHLKLNMNYLAFKVPPQGLFKAIEGMKALGIKGSNVTIPFKEEALKLVDHADPLARKVGAINTIVIKNGESHGYNTDVWGIRHAIDRLNPRRNRALILGAGGVARSAAIALEMEGFSSVFISNRTECRARTLADDMKGNCRFEIISWGAIPEKTSIIINATSLGMETQWPEETLKTYTETDQRDLKVLDLVYRKDGETQLISRVRSCGLTGISGREVLLGQGARAFELFTGLEAPIEIMRNALREEISI